MGLVKTCPLRGRRCMEHGFVHGGEAEELRSGIEQIIDDVERGSYAAGEVVELLRDLLEETDARDSLAWLLNNRKRKAVRK